MTLLALAVFGRGLVEPDEPVLYADDTALLRGQAAFETLRVYAGRPFRLADHLDRLTGSAKRIGLPDLPRAELEELAEAALAAAGTGECVLRFYWTGGREGSARPTAIAMVSPLPAHYEELRARGVRLISVQLGLDAALRASSPWLLGGVKSTSYAVNMAAEAEARRRGADDAVFLGSDETVLEGPVTNVWWRSGRTLSTPSLDLGILAGVTRGALLEASATLGYEVEEGHFTLDRLLSAEEVFTSSSVREVMPAASVDGKAFSLGSAAAGLQAALRTMAKAG